jgi:hypothetical protein
MNEGRKKPGWAFWTTVVVVVVLALVVYTLSWGPACWLAAQPGASGTELPPAFRIFYWPLGRIMYWEIPGAAHALARYTQIGIKPGCSVLVPGKLEDENRICISDNRLCYLP